MDEKLIVGITDCGKKFPNYSGWILAHGANIEIVRLNPVQNNLSEGNRCNAFLLTGGEDVHPRFYGKPEFYEMLDPNDVDERRDEFELKVIGLAEKNNKPLLGICRGLQVANVYYGGTLIPDILTHLNVSGHNQDEDDDSLHHIMVENETLLKKIVRAASGEVNSAHHQSADKIGEGLKANAFSVEKIIEGLELNTMNGEPGVLLVQWHPERMKNQLSSFAGNIREWLINEAWKWK